MNTTTFFNSVIHPFINNDNILVYNGEILSDNIKNDVTRSIENLMNYSRNIYISKIYRSTHCIWYILVKNIPDIYIVNLLKNTLGMAQNNRLLKDTLVFNPHIFFNININYEGYPIYNYLYNIGIYLSVAEDIETNNSFDLLG